MVRQTVWKARGATLNPPSRFDGQTHEPDDDGWPRPEEDEPPVLRTAVHDDPSRSILSTNDSPDIGFDLSINPYRGCEHGCIYCYARPTHAFLGHSPGLDFETQLYAKRGGAELLREALCRPDHLPRALALGTVTDPYQPIERRLGITRSILEVLLEARHPVGIVTKSAAVVRDLDLLSKMAEMELVSVEISITTLRRDLARKLEPRAAVPAKRLAAIASLARAGVPVGVNVAPIIPGLTDPEIESILAAAAEAGADHANHILLRLPFEVKDLFADWLSVHYPDRASHVLSLVRQTRGGRLNDSRFHERFKGLGVYADMIRERCGKAMKRLGLNGEGRARIRIDHFRPPSRQWDLFG
ncbi:MAG: PA0069 family radical SAM protein [Geminicoccaceae bacterium]